MTQSDMFSLKEVSMITGLPHYTIDYMIKTGKIKEPKRIGGMRLFTDKDVNNILKKIKDK